MDETATTWNAAAERLFGFTADEMIGRCAAVLLPPDRDDEQRRCIARVARGERLERYDTVRLRSDGTLVDVAVVLSPIRGEGGEVVAVSVIARDITKRVSSERELRGSLAQLHHVNAELQRKTRSLRTLSACTQAVVRATDEVQLLQAVCSVAVSEGDYLMARVGYREDDERRTVSPVAWAGGNGAYHTALGASWGDGPAARGPVGRSIRENRPVVVGDVASDPDFAPWREAAMEQGFRSVIGLPLTDEEDRPLGSLTIYAAEVEAFDAEEVRLLEQLALDLSYGVTSLRNRAKREAAEQLARDLAYIDALTGLPNRRLLDDRLAMALAHARRNDTPVSAVFVDVDRLKAVNDSLGHSCGDEVIRQMGVRLSHVLRDGDTVARLGGDEFVVILLDCNVGAAEDIAQRILETVSAPMTVGGNDLLMTASVGIAVARGGRLDAETLVRRADEAMYAIKRAGGNGLGHYSPSRPG